MKTLSLVLSTFWVVARKTPTLLSLLLSVARCTPAILRHLPAALVLIGKIRAMFGSEAVQDALKALQVLIDRLPPPTPATDGITPDNSNQARWRRFFRFRNRIIIASIITDTEAQEICDQHGLNSSGTDGFSIASVQYA